MSEEIKIARQNNISLFTDIIKNIQGCQKGKKDFFKCKTCELLGDCFHTASDCIAAICQWIVNTIEGTDDDITSKLDKLTEILCDEDGTEIEEKKVPNTLYT